MIIDLEKTKLHIVDWLRNYAKNAGIKTLVVGLSGGIDSALTALLCKETGIKTVCVIMPCHSSPQSAEKAKNFAKEFGLDYMTVDLTSSYDSIFTQVIFENTMDNAEHHRSVLSKEGLKSPLATGGLRSCLRTPILSYFALASKGLIIGTGNRSEDNLIRYFQKNGDGCVDVSPIADIFKSEVYELFAYMTNLKIESTTKASLDPLVSDKAINRELVQGKASAVAIYESVPSADLWGADGGQTDEEELGFTYDEVEWADRQNMNNGIISSEESPAKHRAWGGYTLKQREVIAKIHQMEKVTRHKFNPNLPVCDVRSVDGLVK